VIFTHLFLVNFTNKTQGRRSYPFADGSIVILTALFYIPHHSQLRIEKCTNSYERCGGYFDDLMSVKGWTIRDDMSVEKENTLWNLSCSS